MRAQLVVLAVVATGCSALINPDVDRLGPEDDAGETTDAGGGTTDAGRDAGPIPLDGGPGDDAGPMCPPSCDDSITCTDDRCESGACVNEPNDASCGDGERCNPVLGCVPNRCERDEECDDGQFCTGAERCDAAAPGTGCVSGDPPACDDGFSCTGDSCDEAADACAYVPNDALCGDTIDCTLDRCAPADADDPSGCAYEANDALCNTDFCTVNRMCNPTRGCRGGMPRNCGDSNVCTADACDGASRACVSTPRDADGDGFPAAFVTDGGTTVSCTGGTDCNDAEGAINPGASESCNGVDDNCNGAIDEGCPPVLAEDCGSAQPITLGATGAGMARGRFDTLTDDYQTSPLCGAQLGGRDAIYYVDLPRGLSDVVIDTIGSTADTVLGIGFTCDDAGLQIACNDDFNGSMGVQSRIWLHRIGSATTTTRVYILVDAYRDTTAGDFVVNVQRRGAASDSCTSIGGSGPLDISGGGTVVGSIDGFVSTQSGSCGGGGLGAAEALFRVTGPADGTMSLTAYATDFTPVVYLRGRTCSGTEVACAAGMAIGGGVNRAAMTPTVTADDPFFFFVDGGRGGYALYYVP